MVFFSDWIWWILSCVLVATAISTALLHKIGATTLAAAVLFSLALVLTMYAMTGIASAITGAALAFFAGLATFLFSLIRSGIQEMLKKRYR